MSKIKKEKVAKMVSDTQKTSKALSKVVHQHKRLGFSPFVDKTIKVCNEQGIDINCKDGEGNTILHYVLGKYLGLTEQTVVQETKKLIDAGADINIKDRNGNTSLMIRYIAVNHLICEEELIKLFLENKADIMSDVFIGDSKPKIPFLFHVIATSESEYIVKLFLEHTEDLIGKKDEILKYLDKNRIIEKLDRDEIVDYLNEKIQKEKKFLLTEETTFSI